MYMYIYIYIYIYTHTYILSTMHVSIDKRHHCYSTHIISLSFSLSLYIYPSLSLPSLSTQSPGSRKGKVEIIEQSEAGMGIGYESTEFREGRLSFQDVCPEDLGGRRDWRPWGWPRAPSSPASFKNNDNWIKADLALMDRWIGISIFHVDKSYSKDFGADQRRQRDSVANRNSHKTVSWADWSDREDCAEALRPIDHLASCGVFTECSTKRWGGGKWGDQRSVKGRRLRRSKFACDCFRWAGCQGASRHDHPAEYAEVWGQRRIRHFRDLLPVGVPGYDRHLLPRDGAGCMRSLSTRMSIDLMRQLGSGLLSLCCAGVIGPAYLVREAVLISSVRFVIFWLIFRC